MRNAILAILLCTANAICAQAPQWRTLMSNYDYTNAITLLNTQIDSLYAVRDTAGTIALLKEKVTCQKNLHKFQEAIGTLEEIMLLGENNAPILASLGECHRLNGNNNAAILFYNLATEMAPDNLFFLIQKANLQYRMEDYNGSISSGRRVLRRDSIPAMMSLIGNSFSKLGLNDSALVYYSAVYEGQRNDYRTLEKISRIFLERKMYDTVLVMANEFLQYDSTNIVINPIKGLVLYNMKKWDEAYDLFRRSVEYGCDKSSGYYYMGLCKMGKMEHHIADDCFVMARNEDPHIAENTDFLYNRAYCNSKMAKVEVADSLFDAVVKLVLPDSTLMYGIYSTRGEMYYDMGMRQNNTTTGIRINDTHLKTAVKFYREALKYGPSHIVLYARIGYCLRVAGDYRNALKYYERYLSLGKEGSYTWNLAKDEIAFIKEELFMQEGKK